MPGADVLGKRLEMSVTVSIDEGEAKDGPVTVIACRKPSSGKRPICQLLSFKRDVAGPAPFEKNGEAWECLFTVNQNSCNRAIHAQHASSLLRALVVFSKKNSIILVVF